MDEMNFRAVILDLDGVVTRTATLHAQAWKQMFDAFLEQRSAREGEDHRPFDTRRDYLPHVDGKPRFDGVRSFLASRGIQIPDGERDDPAELDTVRGLGRRKNDIFLDLLEREGAEVFEDAVQQVRRWQREGLGTALITSSRNGRRILASAGLAELFETVVDGNDAERLGIPGKPAPDVFLHAARELGVEPREAIVVEDAVAGVAAGVAGGFGLVVGVAREGGDALHRAGAHIVVDDLREVDTVHPTPESPPLHAIDGLDPILERLDGRRLALFFDYDGTLTPIVRRPELATLSDRMRALLRELAESTTVAVVSGRDLDDVRAMVQLDEVYYAGSHGFDVAGPGGMRMQQEQARDFIPELDAAERELHDRLGSIEGAWIERKRFAIAVHFREAAERDEPRVAQIAEEVQRSHPRLRKKGGKKIFELQPEVPWDKGHAVRWLLDRLHLDAADVLPVYIGDDVTDEDAFRALRGRGVGIRVGSPDEPTHAEGWLRDPAELERFLRKLLDLLPSRRGHHA
jgi:trehalose-phosphatase